MWLFLYGALDSHPFVPSHVASGRCVLSAAAVSDAPFTVFAAHSAPHNSGPPPHASPRFRVRAAQPFLPPTRRRGGPPRHGARHPLQHPNRRLSEAATAPQGVLRGGQRARHPLRHPSLPTSTLSTTHHPPQGTPPQTTTKRINPQPPNRQTCSPLPPPTPPPDTAQGAATHTAPANAKWVLPHPRERLRWPGGPWPLSPQPHSPE